MIAERAYIHAASRRPPGGINAPQVGPLDLGLANLGAAVGERLRRFAGRGRPRLSLPFPLLVGGGLLLRPPLLRERHLLGGPLPPQGLHRLTNLQKPAGYGTPYYDAALDTAPTTEHAAHEDGELWASLLGSGAPYTGAFAHDETDSQGGYASRGDASEATDAPPREAFIPPPLPRPSPRVSSGALAQAPAAGLDEAGLVMAARIGLNVAGLASASGTLAALNEAVFATPATAARGAASVSRSSLTRGGGMIRPGH